MKEVAEDERLPHEKIAKAVKASLVGYDATDRLDFLVKEVEPGTGEELGQYVCTYLGFHIFQKRKSKDLFNVYCERMTTLKDVDIDL